VRESPSRVVKRIREFVELGRRHPGMTFHGYRVAPERDDERVTLEGFDIAREECSAGCEEELEELGADDFYWREVGGRQVLRGWWS
jgi:hypothetical protein